MRSLIENIGIILVILCFSKLHETKSIEIKTNINESHHILLQQIAALKDIMKHLEKDVDTLHQGLQQQSEIIYEQKFPKIEGTTPRPFLSKHHEQEFEEFYENVMMKLTNSTNLTENSLKLNNELLKSKTQQISQLLESLNNCVLNNQKNDLIDKQNQITKISEQLDKQINRINVLKEKLNALDKHEQDLQKKSDNLSNIMNEIHTKLQNQDGHFMKMEQQLPVLQSANRNVDDYIDRRNERAKQHLERHQNRCKDGNCHRWHHWRHQ